MPPFDDEQVEIALGRRVTTSGRSEQDDAFGMCHLHDAADYVVKDSVGAR
jgi:hypothetical protein